MMSGLSQHDRAEVAGQRPRPPRGLTYDPCHGCGSTALHGKGSLCRECNIALTRGRKAQEADQADSTRQVYWLPDYIGVLFPGEDTLLSRRYFDVREQSHQLAAVISALVNAVGETQQLRSSYPYESEDGRRLLFERHRMGGFGGGKQKMFHPDQAEALNELDKAFASYIQAVYDLGKATGAHLLNRLAAGEVTVAQFNELTQGKE